MIKRAALTQRIDSLPSRAENRDTLDVRLAAMLWELGFLPIPLCSGVPSNGLAEYLCKLAPEAIVLSGGNDIGSAPARDALERAALEYSIGYSVPVLGICRGMQMLNHYQSGRLTPISGHVACRHAIITGDVLDLYLCGKEGINDRSDDVEKINCNPTVNSFHFLAIRETDLGDDMLPLAWSDDGTIEAVRHRSHHWVGIMWHPEHE
ncbi:gamma-glutamyl-gamma-aminobutyrate hydrolase family protein [Halorhodospira halochloris]|uniref:gamma-glutamyl-gamma-aminobutyrate hydrolase family protein n=1 Tax=Halorhodospira halochloris TaxID=1052 RepID=UPI001EE7BE07|nr:gamma-glutamyl-gamma-aminobutyrate hydrolase family protein [Halorhodospira halochloris]MCG5531311.1 gamma-glutamyl-gamma-aminobutyrate hydrolase family protein [Halorhodospira halochloris]